MLGSLVPPECSCWCLCWIFLLLVTLACTVKVMFMASKPQIELVYSKVDYPWSSFCFDAVLKDCPSLQMGFRHDPLLFWGDLMTLTVLARSGPRILYDREVLTMEDGGTISLDWVLRTENGSMGSLGPELADSQAILVLLHGLSGGSDESYVRSMANLAAEQCQFRVVAYNFRCCGSTPVTAGITYSAAWTEDFRHVINYLHNKYPNAPLFAAGFSLGANVLVKYLGEEGSRCPLVAASAVSNPLHLMSANKMLRKGLGYVYDFVLAMGLVDKFKPLIR